MAKSNSKQGKNTTSKTSAKKKEDSRPIEAKLWDACEAQRGSVSPSRYKYPVLGLVFLKYVSDNFEAYRAELERSISDESSADFLPNEDDRAGVLEDRDEYLAKNVFWVPSTARWASAVRAVASQHDIASRIDSVMVAIEKENPSLTGVLPKSFASSEIPQQNLTELIHIIDSVAFGDENHDGRDVLGQVYEFFLGKFSGIERGAGEDFTPRSVVDLLVGMLEPYEGRIYDPCCGTGGMFVQSQKFLEAHDGAGSDVSVFGQESNPETWRLSHMNLALHGIEGDLGDRADSTLTADMHPDLRADFIISNPPFNLGSKNKAGWGRDKVMEDPRWNVGDSFILPPENNANFAWILHFLNHLAPNGYAGFVLANGALSNVSNKDEMAIRKALVEADVVDCIVSLPTKLFANTSIPVSLWFLRKNSEETDKHRARSGETLFINASNLGSLMEGSRRQAELLDHEIAQVVDTYHAFRNLEGGTYEDVAGFCKVASSAGIAENGFVLSPGRYTGTAAVINEISPAERLKEVRNQLFMELDKSASVEKRLRDLLKQVKGDE